MSAIARFVIDSCDHDDYLGTIVATCPNIVVRHFGLQDNHWEGGYLVLWFCIWLQKQIANHGLLNDFVPHPVTPLAPPPGWNDLCWTLLWVRDAQKASRARDAMALRLKEPFQLAVDAKAGLSLTGVFDVLNAALELRDSKVPTGDANASPLQRVPSSKMPEMDHADNVCAVFTTTCPPVTRTFYIGAGTWPARETG